MLLKAKARTFAGADVEAGGGEVDRDRLVRVTGSGFRSALRAM